eukprot:7106591-Heterocapsa_arctica.AAC.1
MRHQPTAWQLMCTSCCDVLQLQDTLQCPDFFTRQPLVVRVTSHMAEARKHSLVLLIGVEPLPLAG